MADELQAGVNLDVVQLKAFIAIHYHKGVCHDQKIPLSDLWSEHSDDFYRATIPKNLFKLWSKVIRFDDYRTRVERYKKDTFAAFREIWDDFNRLLPLHFEASYSVVVDEQLVKSRCRSPHRTYQPAKPGKYGELIRWVADSEYRYVYRGSPLVKKPENEEAAAAHTQVNKVVNLVKYLTEVFTGTGRNVTGDRYFSSFALACDLLTQSRLTYLGTLMANKRDIPPILHKQLPLHSSEFVFGGPNGKVTMCVYAAKQRRSVHMLSTQHHDKQVAGEEWKKKPHLILEYNRTKAGVDLFDQMCREYTTRCTTRRWPVVHFHNLLDIGAINALTIYGQCHPAWVPTRTKEHRRTFLKMLALEMSQDSMKRRLVEKNGLQKPLVSILEKYVGAPDEEEPPQDREKNRCTKCKEAGKPVRNCNLTSNYCQVCGSPVCGKHSTVVGVVCGDCTMNH
jgi:hypothetical protein